MKLIGTIASINVNRNGGVPKHRVAGSRITFNGVAGDKQRYKNHGGPDRAITLLASCKILQMREAGHMITPGSTGENITIRGMDDADWDSLVKGDRLQINNAILKLTFRAPPCSTIAESFINKDFKQMDPDVNPHFARWCASVEKEGNIMNDDEIYKL